MSGVAFSLALLPSVRVGVPVALRGLVVRARLDHHHDGLAAPERRARALGGEHPGRVAATAAVECVRRAIRRERVQRVVAGTAVGDVVPRPGPETIVTRSAANRVVTRATVELVGAFSAVDGVVAGAGPHDVVGTACVDPVGSDPTEDDVAAAVALHDVGACAGPDE